MTPVRRHGLLSGQALKGRLALVAAFAVAAVVAAVSAGGEKTRTSVDAASWRGLVGGTRAAVPLGQRMIVVLRTPSVAQHLTTSKLATEREERAWASQAYAAQQEVLTMLAAHGLGVQPDYSYARVLDGFAAPLDPRAIALLQRDPEVKGIYPVRAAYPASLSTKLLSRKEFAAGEGRRPEVELPGFDGRGVTVALLDTGVDRSQPYLRGRVASGIDLVDKGDAADARPSPQDPSRREVHGTELAGLIVGAGGPAGLHGVATGATVLPIRIAGWQPDAEGKYEVYSRSDQLVAGLDRAVDPNGDGDAHDAARVAVVGVGEPYAAFADGPEADAVAGALALDTVVVAPAGNDGGAGPSFGSVAGPGGAPAALTVGATDGRRATPSVRVVLRRGLQVILDRPLPLLGAVAPTRAVNLRLGVPRAVPRALTRASIVDFFDRTGFSLVAGRAALVPAGGDPAATAVAAARAGAAAVLLYGEQLPAGALGVSNDLTVPVIGVPAGPALALLAARDLHVDIGVAVGTVDDAGNTDLGTVASFSSRGLAFDGRVKPDLAAPGIGLATSDPGASEDGDPAFATVNGTSVAAATVAGAAALLAQARPGLDGPALKSVLAGYARPLAGTSVTRQGAGTLDVGASEVGEVASEPTSLGFGLWSGGSWSSSQVLNVRNVSTRRLRIGVTPVAGGESESIGFTIAPDRLVLPPGAERRVEVTVRVPFAPRERVATGVIEVSPDGGQTLRVPWAIGFRHYAGTLLARVRLQKDRFSPSDVTPTVLEIQAGRLVDDQGVQVEPVSRLDILLYDASGRFIGLLARLRNLLPGSYSFGITGRDPVGAKLSPGRYELRLAAWPTLPGKPSRALVRFEIE